MTPKSVHITTVQDMLLTVLLALHKWTTKHHNGDTVKHATTLIPAPGRQSLVDSDSRLNGLIIEVFR